MTRYTRCAVSVDGSGTNTRWLGCDCDSRGSLASGPRPGYDRAISAVMWGRPPHRLQPPGFYQGGRQSTSISSPDGIARSPCFFADGDEHVYL